METLLRAGLSNAAAATLMALVIMALSRPLARRPAILHGLWVLVLIKLVTPTICEVPIPCPLAARVEPPIVLEVAEVADMAVVDIALLEPGPEIEAPGAGIVGRCATGPARSGDAAFDVDDACRWVGRAWIAGSSIVLVLSLRRVRRFHRLLKGARGGSWSEQEWVDGWARRLEVRRAPDLRWVPGPVSPMIWFVGRRPLLIVPRDLWKRLDGPQRSTLIAHELAHLRRGDHLVRLLELMVTALFWWHPLVWWMRGPMRDVEEQCCDAWVVWALPDAARAYAETLLDTLEFLRPTGGPDPLLASGLGKVPHLRRRLTMIMTGSSRRTPGLAGKLGLAIVAGGLLPVGASWAQKPDEAKQERVVVTTDDTVDGIGLTARVDSSDPENRDGRAASAPNSKHAVVVLRADADAQGDRGVTFEGPVEVHQMELAGPLAGAMKELEAEIVRLKKQGESSDDARQRVKGLVAALDTLKKIGAPPHTMTLRMIGDGEKLGDPKRAQVRFIAKVQKPGTPGEKSEEIGKARKEVEALEGELKAAVERLVKAQARLRELGGDPGGTPNVMWRRSARLQGPVVEKRVTLFRDGEVRTLGPKDVRVEARFGPDKEAAASDQRRLEKLEGRLKALQDEVDRLKKDSKGRGEKE